MQPIPIPKFACNLLRIQVPTDDRFPNGEGVIVELIPINDNDGLIEQLKTWFMCSPQEAIDFGKGLIAEGELARTGIVIPSTW